MRYRELWKWGAEQDSQSSILAEHNHQFFFHLFFFTCTMDFAAKEGLFVDQLHGDFAKSWTPPSPPKIQLN